MAIAIQMPSIDPKKIIIAIIIVLLFLIMFMLGRNSKKDPVQILPTNVSKYERKIDSLLGDGRKLKIEQIRLLTEIDSLKSIKVINHKKVKSDVQKIKNFTYTSRHRFNDSTLRANGLK